MAIPGVDPYIEGNRSELLKAIAMAGSQGEAAYKDAQKQIAAYRQQAIDNAAKGFSGSAELAAQLQAQSGTPFDRRLSDSVAAQADNAAALQRMQAANESYLTNVSAAQGALQAQNANRLADRETQLKALQAQLDAQAKKDEEDRQFERDMALRKDARDEASHQATVANQAAKGVKLTKPLLLGAGQTLSDQYAGFLGMQPGSQGTFSADESARALAAYKGVDPTEVNTLLGPREAPKQPSQPSYQDELTADVRGFAEHPDDPGFLLYSAGKIADAAKVNGGETIVRDILNNEDIQKDIRDFYSLATAPGKDRPSWDEVVQALQEEYLTPTKHGNVRDRTYAVLVELLRGLDWRK